MNFLTSDGVHDLALLALLLMPYGIVTTGALGFVLRRWRPRLTEGKALSAGVGLGAFASVLLRDWEHPSWLVYPAIWIVVALFMRPDRGRAEDWPRTRRVLRPLGWTVVVAAVLAVIVAALAAIAWGVWEALRVPVIGYHAAGGVIGLWLGMLVVLLARRARHSSASTDAGIVRVAVARLTGTWRAWAGRRRVAIYAAAFGILVAGALWREDARVPDAWMAVAGLAGMLLLLALGRRVRRRRPLSPGKAFAAGLIGLGAGAVFMPDSWHWIGEGAIMVGLLIVALGSVHELDAEPHELGARRWWSLVVLAGAVLLASVDAMALNVALPTIASDLEGATTDDLAWVVDSYLLAFAGLLLTGGNLGDRFGRKRMFRAGLVIFGAASLIAAQAQWIELLIGARVLQGIGVALMSPPGLATIVAMFKDGERKTAVGIWTAVNGIGVAIGPIVGGWLVESYSWRWVFLLNVPVVVAALVATRWLVPETTDPVRAGRLDPVGAVLSAAGIGILLWGIIRARSAGWVADEVLVAGGVAALLIGLFVLWIWLRGKHGKPAMLPSSMFNRQYVAATVSMGALYFALFGEAFALTFYLQDVLGYGPLKAGTALLPVAGGILLTTFTSKWLLTMLGHRTAMAAGLTLAALALASLFMLSATSDYWVPVGAALVAVGLGMGIVVAAGLGVIADALVPAAAGAGGAFDTAVRQATGALGVALLASFMGYHYGSRVERDAAALSLPTEPVTAAGESVTAGVGVATRIAEQAPDLGARFLVIVRDAYVYAQQLGAVAIAAPVVGVMVLLVWWALPRKDEQKPKGPDGDKPVAVGVAGPGA